MKRLMNFAEAVSPYGYIGGYAFVAQKGNVWYRSAIYRDIKDLPSSFQKTPCETRINKYNVKRFSVRVYDEVLLYPEASGRGHYIVLIDSRTAKRLFP